MIRTAQSFNKSYYVEPKTHAAKYLCQKSQNEYIKLIGEDVSNRVTEEVNESAMWSVIADTTPDVPHTDQIAVMARYVGPDSGLPTERMVDMKDMASAGNYRITRPKVTG